MISVPLQAIGCVLVITISVHLSSVHLSGVRKWPFILFFLSVIHTHSISVLLYLYLHHYLSCSVPLSLTILIFIWHAFIRRLIINYLLDNGADINYSGGRLNESPLQWAVRNDKYVHSTHQHTYFFFVSFIFIYLNLQLFSYYLIVIY